MTEPSILFCTPCYGGMVTAKHFESCLNLKEELGRVGLAHDWLTGTNESLITRARNEMTATFLTTQHTHLFWLDADIVFTPEDVAKVWNLQADIGVGCYVMKKPDAEWRSAWKGNRLVDLNDLTVYDNLDYAGTGFMCIRRDVIETLASKSESYEGPHGRVPALYMTPIHADGFESEDFYFCRKARDCGFTIRTDPSIRLGHVGQYVYGS